MGKTMQMSDGSDAYQSYLLRLWRARCQGEWQWRASLESRHTGEHQVFAGLDEMCNYLKDRLPECQTHADPRGTLQAGQSEEADAS